MGQDMQTKTLSEAKTQTVYQDQLSLCVFTRKPFPECYCMTISSQNIHKMLDFCAGDYHQCPVYRKNNR